MNEKSIFKKLIICLLIFLMLFNFIIFSVTKTNIVYAETNDELATETETEADSLLGGFLNGLAGILTSIPKALINIMSMLMQTLAYFVIDTAGHGDADVSVCLTPFDIFFNKFTLTNINVFQTSDIEDTSGGQLVYNIREAAALFYYVFRVIAVGILLIILLIIGIKMAIASLAEEKAKLKTMFLDWLVSVGLVVFLHYVILGVITINEGLISLIESAADTYEINDTMGALRSAAFSINFLLGWGATIAYSMITVQTMAFVCIYIVRLFKVLFLIVISPVMPLTFAVDRAKGGQAKAFNGWFRELCYNVFIQPIHCIIYVVIIAVPMSAIETVSIGNINSLTAPLLLIIAIMFVKKAEQLLKSLFGFDNATILTSFNSVVNNSQKAIMTGISIANGTYTVTNNISNNTTTFGSNIQSLGERASNKVHEYRNRAASWLDRQEQAMGTTPLRTTVDSNTDEQNDDIIEAEYRGADEESANAQNENIQNEPSGPIPILLAENILTDAEADKVADAVASTRHEEEYNENKSENINIVENNEEEIENINIVENNEEEIENSEVDEAKEKHTVTQTGLPIKDKDKFDELNKQYEEMINGIKAANDLQKELQTKLDDLETELDDESVDILRKQIEELMEKEGEESAKSYAESFGDSVEGKYAQEYFNYLSNQKALNDMTHGDENTLVELIDKSIDEGLITDDTGVQLLNNAINVAKGEEDKTDEILELDNEDENKSKNEENVEVVQGEVVDITDDLKISKRALKAVISSTRQTTMSNSKILEAVEGDITVEGDFTEAKIIDFNTKILERAKAGAYSESNFQKAEEAVKREGDIAVRRLEKFKAEQSEANARMLTPAGKKYAELMVEAQQAGMFVISAGMAESNNYQESFNQNIHTSRQAINIRRNQEVPTNRSNNVLNDLNQRKKYA